MLHAIDHLDEISVEALQDALDSVERNKPTQRLLAAIAYKNGVTQTELAEWHDTGRRTIYSWLMRLDMDEPLEQAVPDAHRSGRNRKLSESQQEEFEQTVHEPPEKVGIDEPVWTPALVQEFLEDTYDVEYSYPSCRRLLKEAGLSYQHLGVQPPKPKNPTKKRSTLRSKKRAEMDATVVCIDQTKKSVQVEPRAAWFPRGSEPAVELSGYRDWTCLLGAVTDDGECLLPIY